MDNISFLERKVRKPFEEYLEQSLNVNKLFVSNNFRVFEKNTEIYLFNNV